MIDFKTALNEELLFEMANIESRVTGLPYDLWIDSMGKNRLNNHNEPRVKILVDGNFIPVTISDTPNIPESVKKTGLGNIPKFAHVQKYIRAYKEVLLAHYNRMINDTQALELLKTINYAKDAELKLSDMLLEDDLRIEFEWFEDEELFIVHVRNDVRNVKSVQALDIPELFRTINELQVEYGIHGFTDVDNYFSKQYLTEAIQIFQLQ